MAEISAVARPYANAVFELAKESGEYKSWSDALALAGAVAADPAIEDLIQNPQVDRERLAQLLLDICGDQVPAEVANLIRLLARNDRLYALPSIFAQFEALRADAEGTIDAVMIAAQAVDTAQQERIAAALSKRLGRKVNLTVQEDANLIGGAVIRAGDLVIDGSAKTRLNKLARTLVR